MTNVIRFSNPHVDREKIREQACAWLARLDAHPNDIDHEALNSWLGESPEHLEVLVEMASLWDQMAVLSELAEIFPLKKGSGRRRSTAFFRGASAIAAGVCLILACVLLFDWMRGLDARNAAEQVAQGSRSLYETDIGQQSTVSLPDGSQVILNTNTLIEVVFFDNERRVYLRQGEGFFTVARDTSRPFRVFAGQRVVEAVGTAFSVEHTQENSLEVIVTEGKVNFHVLHQKVADNMVGRLPEDLLLDSDVVPLKAGEFAAAIDEAPESLRTGLIRPEEMEVKLAWQHGMLLFQGDSLEQVLKEFGRYTTVKLEATEAVKDIKVEGYYPAGDVERLLVSIRNNFQIDILEIDENHFVLTPR